MTCCKHCTQDKHCKCHCKNQCKGKRPNVVLILVDDLAQANIGAEGDPYIQSVVLPGEITPGGTKNIDKLYRQSVRLNDFHVQPVCTPTRSTLMTGRYAYETGGWNQPAGTENQGSNYLHLNETILPQYFKNSGYRTCISGKWHLSGIYPGFSPNERGFDESLLVPGGNPIATSIWNNDQIYSSKLYHNGNPEAFLGNLNGDGYLEDHLFNKAIDFIEESVQHKKPFFTYIPTSSPHWPYRCPPAYRDAYKAVGVPGYNALIKAPDRSLPNNQAYAEYYGMISIVDKNIGRLLDKLDELDISEDTIVIFITDNGLDPTLFNNINTCESRPLFPMPNKGLRGIKGTPYEGGHRASSYWRYPSGGLYGDKSSSVLSASIDVLPTLIELCNLDPSVGSFPLEGKSLVSILKNTSQTMDPRAIFTDDDGSIPRKYANACVMKHIADKNWRLIQPASGPTGFSELYDLTTDLGQTTNVFATYPNVVSQLTADYEAHWQKVTAQYPVPIGITGSHTYLQFGTTNKEWIFEWTRQSTAVSAYGFVPSHTNGGMTGFNIDNQNSISGAAASGWRNSNLTCYLRDDSSYTLPQATSTRPLYLVEIVNTGQYQFRCKRFPDDRSYSNLVSAGGYTGPNITAPITDVANPSNPSHYDWLFPFNESTPMVYGSHYKNVQITIKSIDGLQTQQFIEPVIAGTTEVIVNTMITIKGKVTINMYFNRQGNATIPRPGPLLPSQIPYVYVTYKGEVPVVESCEKKCKK